jgi:hypothetical protein
MNGIDSDEFLYYIDGYNRDKNVVSQNITTNHHRNQKI